MADEFADLFYLTAIRGHRPRLSEATALTVDEAFALVASGVGVTPGPRHTPPMWPHAIARVPIADVPPFAASMSWRRDDSSPAALAFVRHVLASHAAAPGSRAGPL
jgi:DNA-binding transcriptional LysR family regulator